MGLFLVFGSQWLKDFSNPAWFAAIFAWLFAAMLWLAFSVVRHADALAVKLGEPYGTLILPLAVISIEVVMISAVMLTGGDNPTLARDTMFAVLMIVLNGMVGTTLLVGGLRHREQEYNLQGANAFLSVIIPVAGLGLILPRFTESTPDASPSTFLAVFLIVVSILLYGIFLAMQTTRHRDFFTQPGDANGGHDPHGAAPRSVGFHAVLLVLSMLPIVVLSKSMAKVIDHGIETAGAPAPLGGFLVAVLVLAPEGLGAVRAALSNQLQRTMNICLGSALATIGLTVPAVLTIGLITGKVVELGLGDVDLILLVLSLAVSVVTFSGVRTNVVQGAVHLVLFAAYVVAIFD
ncbi:MAG: calcium:proton antiporter [Planctomycetota bacterium]|nr:MAG: calcium:proton antiporter [Planctomycetota bacterium]